MKYGSLFNESSSVFFVAQVSFLPNMKVQKQFRLDEGWVRDLGNL